MSQPDTDLDPPVWLVGSVDAVLADLQLPRPVPVEVSYVYEREHLLTPYELEVLHEPPIRSGEWTVLVRETDKGGVAFSVWPELRGGELMERLADYLQEQFFPETSAAWGEARPACPGHTHPAVPSFDESTAIAWWSCPATGVDLIEIGHYGKLQRD